MVILFTEVDGQYLGKKLRKSQYSLEDLSIIISRDINMVAISFIAAFVTEIAKKRIFS